jgi:hypothetical protein
MFLFSLAYCSEKGTARMTRRETPPALEGTMSIKTSALPLLFFASIALSAAVGQTALPPLQLPDSPGTTIAQKGNGEGSFQAQATMAPQVSALQSDPNEMQKPVGTAAAEKPATTGVAASNAAGAAIAPAKQRRTRMLLLKVGAILGAGAAVGTVAALSLASPSRPPGSH